MQPHFFFGVPLRARATAQNWDRVCGLLQMCLRSVLNQKDDAFHVVLALHDRPDLPELNDPRIHILTCDTKAPENFHEQMVDKGHKARMIKAAIRALGGGYMMELDADDLVSNRLVEFVRTDQHPFGYLMEDGYEYDYAADRVRGAPRFNRLCGSSAVFHFAADELPTSADDPAEYVSDRFTNHTQWPHVAEEMGRPFKILPFRGAMYLINTGENHSALSGNIGWRRRLLRQIMPARSAQDKMRQEFALERLIA